jgi:hypothetical protein
MTTRVGNNGIVEVDTNQIVELKGWSLDEQAGQIEDTAQGDANATFKPGRKQVTGSIECHHDNTDTTGEGALVPGSEVALVLYPDGNGSGDQRISLNATILGRSRQVQLENIISATYSFAAAGTVTEDTVP